MSTASPRGAKVLNALNAKHPEKIAGWYKDSDGYWINLKSGWQWQECHAVHEWNVRDAIASFRAVEPCHCHECERAALKSARAAIAQAKAAGIKAEG